MTETKSIRKSEILLLILSHTLVGTHSKRLVSGVWLTMGAIFRKAGALFQSSYLDINKIIRRDSSRLYYKEFDSEFQFTIEVRSP